MELVFFITATIMFFFLGIIWTKRNWSNVFVKIVLITHAVAGIFLILSRLGYIVRM